MNILTRLLLCGALVQGGVACSPPAEVLRTQAQLDQERAVLDQQAQTIADLQERRRLQLEQSTDTPDSEFQEKQNEISSLKNELAANQQTDSQLQTAANAALQNQSNAVVVAREQIDNAILSLETAVNETRQQMRWADMNSYKPEMRERLNELNELYALQLRQIDDLRQRKVDLLAGLYVQAQVLTGSLQEQRANLAADGDAIRNRITSLQTEIARTQSTRTQARMSLAPLADEIRSARNAYSEQQRKIQALEASLQTSETRVPASTQ